MINRKTLHLWFIGAISFFGSIYLEYDALRAEARIAAQESVVSDTHNIETDNMAVDLIEGAAQYMRRCGACHSLEANRIGPRHRDVFGRQAGSLSDYEYSDALRHATFIWDEAILERWLTNPEQVVPGQKMGFRLSNAEERSQIIAYLKAQSE